MWLVREDVDVSPCALVGNLTIYVYVEYYGVTTLAAAGKVETNALL